MLEIEIVYLLASSAAIIAMAPQVKQLIVTRQSRELSLPSWCMWCVSQLVAVFYGISLGAVPYIIINSTWLAYYVVMVCLIIKYRRPRQMEKTTANTPSALFSPAE